MRGSILLAFIAAMSFQTATGQDITGDELDEVAMAALDRLQPISIRDEAEYCGFVGIDRDGLLTATPSNRGDRDSCQPDDPPEGFEVLASFHTHGAYAFDADAEVPSLDDLRGDFDEGIDGYIATPGGRVWLIVAEDRRSYMICDADCVTADPDFQECDALLPNDEYTIQTLLAREAADTGEC